MIILISLFLVSTVQGFEPTDITKYWQGYYLINKTGHSESQVTKGSISSLSHSNPAGIMDIDHLSLGVSYQKRSTITNTYYSREGYSFAEERDYIPRSIGLLARTHGIKIAICYDQLYNFSFKFPPMPIIDIEHPEGTGEYFESGDRSHVDKYSLIIGNSLEFTQFSSILQYGLQVSVNDLYKHYYIWHTELTARSHTFSGAIGLLAIIKDNYRIGWSYTQGYKKNFSVTTTISFEEIEYDYVATIPSQMALGLSLPLSSKFDLSIDWKRTAWSSSRPAWDRTTNYSAIVGYSPNGRFRLLSGIQSFNVPTSSLDGFPFGWTYEQSKPLYPFFGITVTPIDRLSVGIGFTSNLEEKDPMMDRDILSFTLEYRK